MSHYQVEINTHTYQRKEVQLETLMVIAGAEGRMLRFAYADSRGNRTAREVQPVSLNRGSNGLYLRAFDFDRNESRTFTVNSMDDIKLGREVPKENPEKVAVREITEYYAEFGIDLSKADYTSSKAGDETMNFVFTQPNGKVLRVPHVYVDAEGHVDIGASLLTAIDL